MALKHAILSRLSHGQARTGYQLVGSLSDLNEAAWHASPSQVYSELHKLAANGMVQATALEDRAGRSYEITDSGREELRRWLRSAAVDRNVRNDSLLRMLMVWMLEPLTARHLIEGEIAFYRGRLMSLRQLMLEWDQNKTDPIFRFRQAGIMLWIAEDETMVRWLHGLLEILEQPDAVVTDIYNWTPDQPSGALAPQPWEHLD